MTYKYQCGEQVIDVWYSTTVKPKVVTVCTRKKDYSRTIHEDERGLFFTWNHEKIYLDNWIRTSMKELKQRIDNKDDSVTDDDLCIAIMSDGVDKVRFNVPINKRAGLFFLDGCDFKMVECKIVESWNREVNNKYKITFVPVIPDVNIADKREFYVSDLISLIKDGYVEIVIPEERKFAKGCTAGVNMTYLNKKINIITMNSKGYLYVLESDTVEAIKNDMQGVSRLFVPDDEVAVYAVFVNGVKMMIPEKESFRNVVKYLDGLII